ncbi:MAG: hypothetical protein FJ206_14075 [Gemmatimonadetes bacterium]|nr:hypothetical protein [Gemmatimonadota bacterium]
MKAFGFIVAGGCLATTALAQVGHDPAKSPYRDLRYGQFVSLTVGKVFGSGGDLGISPHNGQLAILRHDFLADRPLSISLGGGYAKLDRNFPIFGATRNQLSGPVEHDVWWGEGTVQLNLTGGKSWHNLAPYLSASMGIAVAERVPADTSGYKFGTKFFLAPAAGVRIFLTRRLFARVEARANFWSVTYPNRIRDDPDGPFGPEVPLFAGELKSWIPTPILHAGLGFAFRRPFF